MKILILFITLTIKGDLIRGVQFLFLRSFRTSASVRTLSSMKSLAVELPG